MGLLGIDKTSSKTEINTYDQRIAAADEADVFKGAGGRNSSLRGNNNTAVYSKTNVGSGANTGVIFKAAKGSTINVTDGGAAAALADKTTAAFKDALSGTNLAVKDAADQNKAALDAVKDIAKSNTTGGNNQTILYIALGALALGAAVFYFMRK